MIKPLSLYIGWRYTRAKRRNHFISFISFASMLGIAIGVMVLITVLSVINGFDYQIKTRFFAVAPQVTVYTSRALAPHWNQYGKTLLDVPGVVAWSPYVAGKGIILQDGQVDGLAIEGVDPKQLPRISQLANKVVVGQFSSLQAGQYHIILGQALATRLGVALGDKLNIYTPQMNITLAGSFLRYRTFTVTGIFHTSDGFGYDNTVAFIHLADAIKLYPPDHGLRGYQLKLNNVYQAPQVTDALVERLPPFFNVNNWTQQFGAFFQALAMEKTILFVIVLLIVAVAAFNLVSTLVMVVNDKRADIAILRTLGATPRTIMAAIMIQGAIVGLIGVLLGLIAGVILALNATAIVNAVQHLFHTQFIRSSVFILDYLPSRLVASDVIKVCGAAFVLSVVATLYPAWLAYRTQPAEALRYD